MKYIIGCVIYNIQDNYFNIDIWTMTSNFECVFTWVELLVLFHASVN